MKLNVTVGAFGVPVAVQLENLHKILDCFIRNPSIISVVYFGVPYPLDQIFPLAPWCRD
ncbi:hypothetical protein [Mesorhizobium sp.]|uniref:hypothetical protein n=1 Tax=Mesorhizobium sp. TaxID=1871066 RepID=UPI002580E789|nr:hypothetical protein [Mesorhizobium sp.]